ncbi:MAG: hypothetical protein OXI17_03490 [Gammaproteobacteria bacterium]|nr:hypothetical protein [Gammaproteobacteria bacterium]
MSAIADWYSTHPPAAVKTKWPERAISKAIAFCCGVSLVVGVCILSLLGKGLLSVPFHLVQAARKRQIFGKIRSEAGLHFRLRGPTERIAHLKTYGIRLLTRPNLTQPAGSVQSMSERAFAPVRVGLANLTPMMAGLGSLMYSCQALKLVARTFTADSNENDEKK